MRANYSLALIKHVYVSLNYRQVGLSTYFILYFLESWTQAIILLISTSIINFTTIGKLKYVLFQCIFVAEMRTDNCFSSVLQLIKKHF